MPADPSVCDSDRLARAYAHDRPPIHAQICAEIDRKARPDGAAGRLFRSALDAGCGAGASTAALLPCAERLWGVDPFDAMLGQARQTVPTAEFRLGRLEQLPFESASFELVTSAGAINYTVPEQSLSELNRVMLPGGWLALYDFGSGLPVGSGGWPEREAQVLARMRAAHPSDSGYGLDLTALPLALAGLHLHRHRRWFIDLPMTLQAYLDYCMSGTAIGRSLARGADAGQVRSQCQDWFGPAFRGESTTMRFPVELLLARRLPQSGSLSDSALAGH